MCIAGVKAGFIYARLPRNSNLAQKFPPRRSSHNRSVAFARNVTRGKFARRCATFAHPFRIYREFTADRNCAFDRARETNFRFSKARYCPLYEMGTTSFSNSSRRTSHSHPGEARSATKSGQRRRFCREIRRVRAKTQTILPENYKRNIKMMEKIFAK